MKLRASVSLVNRSAEYLFVLYNVTAMKTIRQQFISLIHSTAACSPLSPSPSLYFFIFQLQNKKQALVSASSFDALKSKQGQSRAVWCTS